mmetsp:Transcript_17335/g.39868  ORF Transcript_17335/g.39868 Transcript_17335/m.39868 type:complete len:148 (-) Transcript_17335:259-702(-)
MTRVVGIKATYTICGNDETTATTSQNFDASNSNISESRVGLPVGVEPVKPQPGDEAYSGMHDHGPLPELKEGGSVAFLIGCAKMAKQYNNDFLTECIEKEKKSKQQQQQHSTGETIHTIRTAPAAELGSTSNKETNSPALPNKRMKQ